METRQRGRHGRPDNVAGFGTIGFCNYPGSLPWARCRRRLITCLVTALTTLPALLILTKTRVARRLETMSVRGPGPPLLAACAALLIGRARRGAVRRRALQDAVITRIGRGGLAVDRNRAVSGSVCHERLRRDAQRLRRVARTGEEGQGAGEADDQGEGQDELTVCTIAPRKARIKKPRS